MKYILRLVFILGVMLVCVFPVHAQTEGTRVLLLVSDEPVAPAMAEYYQRGIERAERGGYDLMVIELNTPGGTIDALNDILQDMRSSNVPIIVWVAPRGAMAASAGTIITLAGHGSAMANETSIGAASPVGGQGEDLEKTLAAKEKNVLKATVRSLADRRGEEAVQLAESTIESAVAVSATEAYEAGLIDVIADDIDSLLAQFDGFTVQINGESRVLNTQNAEVVPFNQTFIENLLSILTNPNIVFLLITIGVQAILIEISSPGGWVAGFIGVVCLALATYGLGVLPVNWFGIVFLITAFVLFILDIKAPTHGGLTIAGVASLIVGALVLFNSPSVPSFSRVSVPLVVVSSVFTGVLFFLAVMFAVRAQKTPIRVGQESLIGKRGFAKSEINPNGIVHVSGEQWTAELAEGETAIPINTAVLIVRVDGLRLIVKRA
jgi:membrane-bound serine protease (ClpP class)